MTFDKREQPTEASDRNCGFFNARMKNYIEEQKTIKMNGNNTPGDGGDCRYYDINHAGIPTSKEDGGNLKKVQEDIQYRFDAETVTGLGD